MFFLLSSVHQASFASLGGSDGGTGAGAFSRFNGLRHGDAKFSLLAAVAAKGMEDDSMFDEVYQKDLEDGYTHDFSGELLDKLSFSAGMAAKGLREDDFPPLEDHDGDDKEEDEDEDMDEDEDEEDEEMDDAAGDKTACAADEELEKICNAMASDSTEHLINVVLGGGTDCEFFTNGFGFHSLSEGPLHRPIVETQKRKASFLANWSGPSAVLRALPFIWQRRRSGRVHYFADVFLVCQIVAETLGFKSASAYVKCRGWTFHKKGGKNKLQYRKLENVFDDLAPNGQAALLAKNLHAMVKEIYGVFDDDLIKDIYTGLPALPLLQMCSFISKLHVYAQEFQIGLIVVTRFFMVSVPDHKDDPEYWMKRIFESCTTHYDYITFCHNCFSIFPSDKGNPKLATKLLTKLKNMRDVVYRRASAKNHQEKYGKKIEASLQKSRGTRSDAMPLPNKELLLCRARARDLYFATLSPESRANLVTTTRRSRPTKKQKTKATSSGEPGK